MVKVPIADSELRPRGCPQAQCEHQAIGFAFFPFFFKLNQVIKQQFRNVQENSDNEL